MLSYGVDCVIRGLAIFVELQLVTDGHTMTAYTALRQAVKTAEQIEFVFGTQVSFGLSYIVLKGNSGISKNNGISL